MCKRQMSKFLAISDKYQAKQLTNHLSLFVLTSTYQEKSPHHIGSSFKYYLSPLKRREIRSILERSFVNFMRSVKHPFCKEFFSQKLSLSNVVKAVIRFVKIMLMKLN